MTTKLEALNELLSEQEILTDENGKNIVELATCGTCNMTWNDAAISGRTPAPSARCPFEQYHAEWAKKDDEEDEPGNDFDLACPKCGNTERLDVCASIWVRLTPDGTDTDESESGHDHEWDENSEINCCACGNAGKVYQFRKKEDAPANV